MQSIEKRSKKRNKNIEELMQMKQNYLSFKIQRNHENEINHLQKMSMNRRRELNRKEKLIDKILNKNNK
jgi:hypothetical protein